MAENNYLRYSKKFGDVTMDNPQRSNLEIRPVPGHNGYFCREDGAIFSTKRGTWKKLTEQTIHNGYKRVYFRVNGKCVLYLVHRIVALTFIGEPPHPKMEVNHKDGNKANNHKDNLEYVTRSQNQKHAFSKGLNSVDGKRNPNCKLTEDQVIRIYHRRFEDTTSLMNEFGVTRSTIHRIKHKNAWRRLLKNL